MKEYSSEDAHFSHQLKPVVVYSANVFTVMTSRTLLD